MQIKTISNKRTFKKQKNTKRKKNLETFKIDSEDE